MAVPNGLTNPRVRTKYFPTTVSRLRVTGLMLFACRLFSPAHNRVGLCERTQHFHPCAMRRLGWGGTNTLCQVHPCRLLTPAHTSVALGCANAHTTFQPRSGDCAFFACRLSRPRAYKPRWVVCHCSCRLLTPARIHESRWVVRTHTPLSNHGLATVRSLPVGSRAHAHISRVGLCVTVLVGSLHPRAYMSRVGLCERTHHFPTTVWRLCVTELPFFAFRVPRTLDTHVRRSRVGWFRCTELFDPCHAAVSQCYSHSRMSTTTPQLRLHSPLRRRVIHTRACLTTPQLRLHSPLRRRVIHTRACLATPQLRLHSPLRRRVIHTRACLLRHPEAQSPLCHTSVSLCVTTWLSHPRACQSRWVVQTHTWPSATLGQRHLRPAPPPACADVGLCESQCHHGLCQSQGRLGQRRQATSTSVVYTV